jgi:5-methylcytosine-specific restriction endonuclease McrA
MPIKPENRNRYPANWAVIREVILCRARHRCEGSPDFPDCRAANHQAHPDTGSKVVLTIAHLDHTPEHNDPSNLAALCQRCHLNYDRKARVAAKRATLQHLLEEA